MCLFFGPKKLLLVFLLTLFEMNLVVLPFNAIRFSAYLLYISLFFNFNNLLFKSLFNDLVILPGFGILMI